MNKPVGGRGKKAPYQTIIIRIPIDLKPEIDELVDRFRSGSLEIEIDKNIDNIKYLSTPVTRLVLFISGVVSIIVILIHMII